jgi:hypothetical protein
VVCKERTEVTVSELRSAVLRTLSMGKVMCTASIVDK